MYYSSYYYKSLHETFNYLKIGHLVLCCVRGFHVITVRDLATVTVKQCVALATEPAWLADRCSMSQQLGTLQTHSFPFLTQQTYSCSNFVAISSSVLELLKKCRVRQQVGHTLFQAQFLQWNALELEVMIIFPCKSSKI